ncbi:MAG: CarD family transcriptional regulator [Desulfobacterales bacterium]|nr:CarD family transcriptional regulator [Desulfobacterales bacterium]
MGEKAMINIDFYSNEIINREFKVGGLAVYPAHGVGRIESIETRVINGSKHDFYILKILENSMIIMIPKENASSVGLRNLIEEDDIPKVYSVIKEKEIQIDNQTWNRRYREYMEKIKTGSLFDVAGVYRDLFLRRMTKDLSFGERKLFDTAQSLLIREICTAKKVEADCILSEIEALFIPLI